jgi:hypothetical protein
MWFCNCPLSLLSKSTTGVKLKEMVYLKKVNIWGQLQHEIDVTAIIQHMLVFSSIPEILCHRAK